MKLIGCKYIRNYLVSQIYFFKTRILAIMHGKMNRERRLSLRKGKQNRTLLNMKKPGCRQAD